jgi:hypothetical protein
MPVHTKVTMFRRPRRRGTALIEFVMAVPFLAFIIALIFFFGWSMTNQQHVKVSDRYTTWRETLTNDSVTDDDLNRLFFQRRAQNVDITRGSSASVASRSLVGEAGRWGRSAGELSDRLVAEFLPGDRSTEVGAEFRSSVGAWRRLTGAIHSRHDREGVQWEWRDGRAGDARCERAVCEQFLRDLDDKLKSVPPPGEGICEVFRWLLYNRWARL